MEKDMDNSTETEIIHWLIGVRISKLKILFWGRTSQKTNIAGINELGAVNGNGLINLLLLNRNISPKP